VASREEAAQYWRRRNRPAARLQRFARALVAAPVMKVAGAAVLGSASVAALAVALPHGSGDTPAATDGTLATATATATESLATNGVRDFTVAEATDLALKLGTKHLEAAKNPGEIGLAQLDGRTVRVEDLVLRDRLFEPLTSSVTFSDAVGNSFSAGGPSDRWGFLFELDGLSHPDMPGEAALLRLYIVVEDGTGTAMELSSRIGASEMSLASVDSIRRAARGEDVSPGAETIAANQAAPRVFAVQEDDLRRISVSVYGDPADPCLRFDDTATPDRIGTICPAKSLRGEVLYSMMSNEDFVVGTTAPDVANAVAVDDKGVETTVSLYPLPADYVGTLKMFLGFTGAAVSLQLRAADGQVLFSQPLPRPDAGVVLTTRSVWPFGMEGPGSATSDEFEVDDGPLGYAFIFEFPGESPVVLRALCDAGEQVILDVAGPVAQPQSSLVIHFPPESTRCSLRVETEPGTAWRLYSK
jgi:hypothetical protein